MARPTVLKYRHNKLGADEKLTFFRRMARIESRSEVEDEEALRRRRSCGGFVVAAAAGEQQRMWRRWALPAEAAVAAARETAKPRRLEEALHTRSASIRRVSGYLRILRLFVCFGGRLYL
jgi:hypothetical protein